MSDEKKIKFDETLAFTFLQKKKKSHLNSRLVKKRKL